MTARKPRELVVHPDDRRIYDKYCTFMPAEKARTLVRLVPRKKPDCRPLTVCEYAALHALLLAGLCFTDACKAIGRQPRRSIREAITPDWRVSNSRVATGIKRSIARDMYHQGHAIKDICAFLGCTYRGFRRLRQIEGWRPMYRRTISAKWEPFREMFEAGMGRRELARLAGCHPNTINRVVRDYGWSRRRQTMHAAANYANDTHASPP